MPKYAGRIESEQDLAYRITHDRIQCYQKEWHKTISTQILVHLDVPVTPIHTEIKPHAVSKPLDSTLLATTWS